MKVRVDASPGRLPEIIEARRHAATQEVVSGLRRIGELGVREATARAPHGPTGNYAEGLDSTATAAGDGMSVTIGGRAAHSHLVERGRRPGRIPPTTKIAVLFGISRSQAFTVARAIGRRGTQGQHVLERTADAIRPDVSRIAGETLRDIGRLR